MKIMIFLVARLVEFLQCLLVIKNACNYIRLSLALCCNDFIYQVLTYGVDDHKNYVQGDPSPRFPYCVALNLGVPPAGFRHFCS